MSLRRTFAASVVLAAAALAAAPVFAGDPPRRHAAHARPARSASSSSHAATTPAPIPAPDPFPFSSAPAPPGGHFMVEGSDGKLHECQEQRAQDFLIRSNWFNHGAEGSQLFQKSLRYRTEHYGYFPGFGRPEWNARHSAPRDNAVTTHFLGMPIQINERIVPALKCVEAAILAGPAHLDYRPHGIGGIRFHNTYYGGEVSNHVYGIAMDIDSDTNTCCGCVGAWAKHPACGRRVSSIYERMSMPNSWVETFERYGWYWLGHDVLQDTMHFEFLGDPDKILVP